MVLLICLADVVILFMVASVGLVVVVATCGLCGLVSRVFILYIACLGLVGGLMLLRGGVEVVWAVDSWFLLFSVLFVGLFGSYCLSLPAVLVLVTADACETLVGVYYDCFTDVAGV